MAEKTSIPERDILVPCLYFTRPGPQNTRRTLERAAQRADELGIGSIVVASASGRTGITAANFFASKNLVVVTHSAGFLGPNVQEMKPAARKKLVEAGARVLTCQHALGGVGRAVRKKLGTYELEEIIAYTLRIFGQGTKVAVEIALMAADAGLVPAGEPCISIGGTSSGADTAVLLKPSNAQSFFDLRVVEVLAKPRLDAD
ncbi:MAG TPA: pyruvate kinase alpha/beta domain-containing protein [Candidatus Aminicenantes bacterium]|nr:pyruvate kinase alpha/beta domain-containing protein [Candidatus Aminicenantes bacterium]